MLMLTPSRLSLKNSKLQSMHAQHFNLFWVLETFSVSQVSWPAQPSRVNLGPEKNNLERGERISKLICQVFENLSLQKKINLFWNVAIVFERVGWNEKLVFVATKPLLVGQRLFVAREDNFSDKRSNAAVTQPNHHEQRITQASLQLRMGQSVEKN